VQQLSALNPWTFETPGCFKRLPRELMIFLVSKIIETPTFFAASTAMSTSFEDPRATVANVFPVAVSWSM
jgi:hypothetical protein